MNYPEKLLDFLASKEFIQIIDKFDEFLKIDPKIDSEKDNKVTLFLYNYFHERLSGSDLKNFAKKTLDFLSDEEIDNLLNFIQENLFELREKLWKEEIEAEKIEEIVIETFEEKAKKYQEIMEPLIRKSEKEKEIKTISFEPSEEPIKVKEQEPEILPETTIVIKKEEKVKKGEGETLDLSKL